VSEVHAAVAVAGQRGAGPGLQAGDSQHTEATATAQEHVGLEEQPDDAGLLASPDMLPASAPPASGSRRPHSDQEELLRLQEARRSELAAQGQALADRLEELQVSGQVGGLGAGELLFSFFLRTGARLWGGRLRCVSSQGLNGCVRGMTRTSWHAPRRVLRLRLRWSMIGSLQKFGLGTHPAWKNVLVHAATAKLTGLKRTTRNCLWLDWLCPLACASAHRFGLAAWPDPCMHPCRVLHQAAYACVRGCLLPKLLFPACPAGGPSRRPTTHHPQAVLRSHVAAPTVSPAPTSGTGEEIAPVPIMGVQPAQPPEPLLTPSGALRPSLGSLSLDTPVWRANRELAAVRQQLLSLQVCVCVWLGEGGGGGELPALRSCCREALACWPMRQSGNNRLACQPNCGLRGSAILWARLMVVALFLRNGDGWRGARDAIALDYALESSVRRGPRVAHLPTLPARSLTRSLHSATSTIWTRALGFGATGWLAALWMPCTASATA
jgi:hypothetical protein